MEHTVTIYGEEMVVKVSPCMMVNAYLKTLFNVEGVARRLRIKVNADRLDEAMSYWEPPCPVDATLTYPYERALKDWAREHRADVVAVQRESLSESLKYAQEEMEDAQSRVDAIEKELTGLDTPCN